MSPALVIHHFGSKAGLHPACDDHIVHSMMEMKHDALESGSYNQAGAISSLYQLAAPSLRYLAWTLGTGSETAARIFEDFVDEATELLLDGKKTGLIGTVHGDPRRQAAVLVGMQLASMVFHDHLSRVFDLDMLSAEGLMAAAPYTLQVFSGELFNQDVIAKTRLALSDLDPNQEPDRCPSARGIPAASLTSPSNRLDCVVHPPLSEERSTGIEFTDNVTLGSALGARLVRRS